MEMESTEKTILYITVNTINNKIYIGTHVTATPYKFDNYWGDGITGPKCYHFLHPKTLFQRACKKYGLDAFRRHTLKVFDTLKEALKEEAFIVDEEFLKRPDVYNTALGGGSGLVPLVEKKVHQYDLQGNYIKSYRSQSSAARQNGVHSSQINQAVLYNRVAVNSYWSSIKVDTLNIANYNKLQSTSVFVYSKDGKKVNEFKSIADTARYLDVNVACVNRAIEWKTLCGGYYLSFDNLDTFIKEPKKRIRHSIIYQYDLNGNYINEMTYKQAHKLVGKGIELLRALREKYSCGGYLWSKEKVDHMKPLKQTLKKKVYQYDLNNNLVKVWDSFRECQKEFCSLRLVLSGKRTQTKGFKFSYTKIENQ